MKNSIYARAMKGFSFLYAIVGLVFFFLPGLIEFLLGFDPAPNRFWIALTTSMMAMLSAQTYFASQKPEESAFLKTHLISKSVSVSGFLLAGLIGSWHWGYLIGAVVDGSIILLVVWLWRKSYELPQSS